MPASVPGRIIQAFALVLPILPVMPQYPVPASFPAAVTAQAGVNMQAGVFKRTGVLTFAGPDAVTPGPSSMPIRGEEYSTPGSTMHEAQGGLAPVFVLEEGDEVALAYRAFPVGSDVSSLAMESPDSGSAMIIILDADSGQEGARAAWLSLLEAAKHWPADRCADTLFMVRYRTGSVAPVTTGAPLVRQRTIAAAVAEMGPALVVTLTSDDGSDDGNYTIFTADGGRQAPLATVRMLEKAAAGSGFEPSWQPVIDVYASLDLYHGDDFYASLLVQGIPAIRLDIGNGTGQGPIDTFFLELAGLAGGVPFLQADDAGKHGDFKLSVSGTANHGAWFRYPLPSGMLTIDDTASVIAVLALVTMLAFGRAIMQAAGGKTFVSRHGAIIRESVTVLSVTIVAVNAAALSGEVMTGMVDEVSGFMVAVDSASAGPGPVARIWLLLLLLLVRGAASLSVFYALSGLLSLAGVAGKHTRSEASLASFSLLVFNGIAAMVRYPQMVPFLVVSMFLVAMGARTGIASMSGLLAALLIAVPFLNPQLLTAHSADAGWGNSLIGGLVLAPPAVLAAVGAFFAPYILWLVAASSPATHLHRGKRTLGFWLAGIVVFSLAEAIVRHGLGSP